MQETHVLQLSGIIAHAGVGLSGDTATHVTHVPVANPPEFIGSTC